MNRLRKGDILQSAVDSRKFQVLSTELIDGKIELYSCQESARMFRPLAEIHSEIASQQLRLERQLQQAPVSPVEQDDPNYQQDLRRANYYLRKVLSTAEKLGICFDRAQSLERADTNDVDFPSRTVLYRYRDAHYQGRPLLKGNRNKGCRKPRYREEVYRLIEQYAPNLYCMPESRWRMQKLVQFINQQARELGYITPEKLISQRHISGFIQKLGFVDADAHRLDPKLVAAARSIGAKRVQTNFPLERVEMDSLHLPFVVRTAYGQASHVHCTHAIDDHTGVVLGWHITLGSPNEDSGLACVHSTLYSKQADFQRLGLSYDFDIQGTPSLIIFDNGPEAKGQRMENLIRIGIDTEHCPGRNPHKKPFIERLNRSLKNALETLPGCTRIDGVDGKRDPIALQDPLMTIEELERWIVRWYYEQWANHVLERHLMTNPKTGATPLKRWQHFTQQAAYVMPLPVPIDDWRKVTLIKTQRKLSRKTGVSFHGLNYKGPNLTYLVQRFNQGMVTTYSDPTDYRTLFVDDGTQLIELVEEFVQPDSPAYTITDHKARCKTLGAQAKDTRQSDAFFRDVFAKSLEDSGKKPRRKSTVVNQQTTEKHKESQAIKRAIAKPLKTSSITGELVSKVDDITMAFDDLQTLAVLDRRTGGAKA